VELSRLLTTNIFVHCLISRIKHNTKGVFLCVDGYGGECEDGFV